MTALDVLRAAVEEDRYDTQGNSTRVTLLPPTTANQIQSLGVAGDAISADMRELLHTTSGFKFAKVGRVDFLGRDMSVETFFRSVPILGDDSGNFWVLDLQGAARGSGAVIFWCHDPPVAVIEAPTLAEFLQQVFSLGRRPHDDALTFVKRTCAHRTWRRDPFLVPAAEAAALADEELSRSVPSFYHVADLRSRETGKGFSWGKSASNMRRAGSALIFAVERVGSVTRLLG